MNLVHINKFYNKHTRFEYQLFGTQFVLVLCFGVTLTCYRTI